MVVELVQQDPACHTRDSSAGRGKRARDRGCASRRCCKASVAGYRGRTGRPTVGHAIGRRRADRSGSGVAPARIGRAAGIWDRDSLLAGVALLVVSGGSATNGDGQPQAKEGTE